MAWRRTAVPASLVLPTVVLSGLAMGPLGRQAARRRGIPLWRDFPG